ncbi:MAG: 50S ribosomal protein L18 [Phototrophicales bacterium]|nr:MAG: 50S ribosomal protein L18 [Phototrophicales bacterium]RMG70103.1 MAG: 50S ribosomal protein L18 [Chloroflexota bacterium]
MGDIKSKEKVLGRQRRHKRVRGKIQGTAQRPRLNVFRSLSNITAQVIDDIAGKTLVSASTLEADIAKQIEGKNKVEAARVVGKIVAERAKTVGITSVVFDRGGYKYHGRVKALADGAREAGLDF